MKIYTISVREGYEWILPRDPSQHERFLSLAGMPQRSWNPPEMEFVSEGDDGSVPQRSDFPWLGEHLLIMRSPAVEAIRPFVDAYGEFLPLRCYEEVWLFNATSMVDALDEENSHIVRFDDGSILAIEKHVLRPDVIGGAQLFKLRERPGGLRASAIYLQEPLTRQIGRLGLTGIAFDLVWSDVAVSAADSRIEY